MRKERHNYTAEDKVVILKRHLLERVAVSDICYEYKLPLESAILKPSIYDGVEGAFVS